MNLALWGQKDRQLSVRLSRRSESPTGQGIWVYAPDFFLQNSQPWYQGESPVDLRLRQNPTLSLAGREVVGPDWQRFAEDHAQVLKSVEKLRVQKLVPYVCEEWRLTRQVDLTDFLSANKDGVATRGWIQDSVVYGFEYDGEGAVGITPEILFERDGDTVRTMALAGTAPVESPSLLENAKEFLEHQIVIESIVQSLTPLGEVEVGSTQETVMGMLKHLRTPIELKLNREIQFEELVNVLHPTAALGGWPKREALEWLSNKEIEQPRGRFGAPFGFVNGDRWLCSVLIRGVQFSGYNLRLYTGCGVVRGSKLQSEIDELKLKRCALLAGLGIASES